MLKRREPREGEMYERTISGNGVAGGAAPRSTGSGGRAEPRAHASVGNVAGVGNGVARGAQVGKKAAVRGRVVQLKGGGVKGKLCEFLTFFHVTLYRRW